MARVTTYERPVDVIIINSLDCGTSWSGTLPKVKEEPLSITETTDQLPDSNNEPSIQYNSQDNIHMEGNESNATPHISDYDAAKLRELYEMKLKGKARRAKTKFIIGNMFDRAVTPKRSRSANKSVCQICFMIFENPTRAKYHNKSFMCDVIYTCKVCKLKLSSRRLAFHHYMMTHTPIPTSKKIFYFCNFCMQRFQSKSLLQAHLFHFHSENIYSSTKTPTHLSIEQQENTKISNTSTPSPASKTTPKKMRQTTLTEFINFSSPPMNRSAITDSLELSEKKIGNLFSAELVETPKLQKNQPVKNAFVQIHVPIDEYFSHPSENTRLRTKHRFSNSGRRHTPYSLRRSASASEKNVKINFTQATSSPRPSPLRKTPLRSPSTTIVSVASLLVKYKCRDCSIPLVRCDAKPVIPEKSAPSATEKSNKQTKKICLPKLSKNGTLMLNELKVSLERISIPREKDTLQITESVNNDQIERRGTFPCKVCDETLSSKEDRKIHVKAKHTAYMSSICNARYTMRHMLIVHYLRQHYLFKRNECCVCGKPCSDRMALRRHLLLHCIKITLSKQDTIPVDVDVSCRSYHKTNKCQGCSKTFWLHSCLQQHQRICQMYQKLEDVEHKADEVEDQMPTTEPAVQFKEQIATCQMDTSIGKDVSMTTQQYTSSSNQDSTINVTSTEATINSQIIPADPNLSLLTTNDVVANDNKQKYFCEICHREYQSYKNLQQHLRLFTKLISEPCNVCGTVFGSTRLLRAHMNATHVPEIVKSYSHHCKFCNQGFCKKESLQMHELHLHPEQSIVDDNERPVNVGTTCNVCNLIFESHDRYVEHNMYYDKGQAFSCAFCGKLFNGMYVLHHHNKKVHYPQLTTTSYSYTCDICEEGFNHETHFHAHKVHVHSIDFSLSDSLNRTLANSPTDSLDTVITSTEPTYTCNVCEMSFDNIKELEYHESDFSNDGPFLCDKCSKRFRSQHFLIKHQVLSHPLYNVKNEFNCDICQEVLTSAALLTSHVRHFHPKPELSPAPETSALTTHASEKKCIVCKAYFETDSDLVHHLLQYANRGNYPCDVCKRKFYYSEHLEKHTVMHSTSNVTSSNYQCSVCKEGLPTIAVAVVHVAHLHKNNNMADIIIVKGATTQNGDETNNKNHAMVTTTAPQDPDDTLTGVSQRPAGSSQKLSAVQDKTTIMVNEPISQPSDNEGLQNSRIIKSTAQEIGRDSSFTKKQRDDAKHVKCDICDVKFNKEADLHDHRRKFGTKGEYMCEFCGLKFTQESRFKEHRRTHMNKSNGDPLKYECSFCDERFRTAIYKQAHIAHVHGNDIVLNVDAQETSNPCDTTKRNLRRVSETSSGTIMSAVLEQTAKSRPTVGTAVETQKMAVDNDVTDVNGYLCPVCINRFPCLLDFETHFRSRHSELAAQPRSNQTQLLQLQPEANCIACVICNAVFRNAAGYKKHLSTVHTPSMNLTDSMKKRFVKIVKRIPVAQSSSTTQPSPVNVTPRTNVPEHRIAGELQNSGTGPNKQVNVTRTVQHAKPLVNNVGKLKVKDFAKLVDKEVNVPKSQPQPHYILPKPGKYVVLQPELSTKLLGNNAIPKL